MKRTGMVIISLVLLSMLSGFLMSKASWVGRTGMTLVYTEYSFLKSWWKGALVVFIILVILYLVQAAMQRKKNPSTAKGIHMLAILVALVGFYFTYNDFQNTISHRLLGTSFHIGAYLFWLGWIGISLFFLIVKGKNVPLPGSQTSERLKEP